MKKFLLITAAILAIGITAQAGTVSQKEARQTALKFFKKAMNKQGKKLLSNGRQISSSAITLEQARSEGDTPLYYIYNLGKGDGFAIVSAVEETPQILGYSLNGNIDSDNMPSNMKAFMDSYAKGLKTLADNPEMAAKTMEEISSISTEGRETIDSLIKTRWGQDVPYNLYCPSGVNSKGDTVLCPTGCVATAMAQIMKYYNDEKGWFSKSKEIKEESTNKVFKETTFNYADCKYIYNNANLEADSSKAVALLMRYCGAAVEMDYKVSESGATSEDAVTAINTYFAGEDSIKALFYTRQRFNNQQWDSIVYNEICNKRPLLFGGYGIGGHAFVCDGYNADDGTYHINWGWYGISNGYFDLFFLFVVYQQELDFSINNSFITILPAIEAKEANASYLKIRTESYFVKDNGRILKINLVLNQYTDSILNLYPRYVVTDPNGIELFSCPSDTIWDIEPNTIDLKDLEINIDSLRAKLDSANQKCNYYKLNITIDKDCKTYLDYTNCYNYYFSCNKDTFYMRPNVSWEWLPSESKDADMAEAFIGAKVKLKKMPLEKDNVYAKIKCSNFDGDLFVFEKELTESETIYTIKSVYKSQEASYSYPKDDITLVNGVKIGEAIYPKTDNASAITYININDIEKISNELYRIKSDTICLSAKLQNANKLRTQPKNEIDEYWKKRIEMPKSFFLSKASGIKPQCTFAAIGVLSEDSTEMTVSAAITRTALIDSIKSHGLSGDTLRLSAAVDELGYFRPYLYMFYDYFIYFDENKDSLYVIPNIKITGEPEYYSSNSSDTIRVPFEPILNNPFRDRNPNFEFIGAIITLFNDNDNCWIGNSRYKGFSLNKGIIRIYPENEYKGITLNGTYNYEIKLYNGLVIDTGTITIDSSSAIKETKAEAEEKAAKGIYNLQGQKIQDEPQQGLYIKNGKVTLPKRQ